MKSLKTDAADDALPGACNVEDGVSNDSEKKETV